MLQHNNVAKMEFTWSLKQAGKPWCVGEDVVTALEKEWVAEITCSTSRKAKEGEWCGFRRLYNAFVFCVMNVRIISISCDIFQCSSVLA